LSWHSSRSMLGLASFVAPVGAIPSVPIGTAGQRMPLISLGTGSGQHGDVENATAEWLQVGGSGIDTAYIYDDEAPIAAGVKAVGASWESIFLTTKIPCATTQAAKANVASNLRSLGVGSVDLLLIHSPRPWSGGPGRCSVAETWAVLEEALAAGQARSIGVSNFQISDLEMLARTAKVRQVRQVCAWARGTQ
jgi:diketogulonate reductase-like aldo/keto reductase